MTQISQETKSELRSRFPLFQKACHAFYAKELPPAKYKSTSGKFGSYGERGGQSSMLRLRFSGGAIKKEHVIFLHDIIERYQPALVHFTTGEALQIHHLSEHALLSLYQECFDAGIYCYGAGSDNPRNITASPLHGVEEGEYFDMTPYIEAASHFVINLMPKLNLPRKFKISFSNGLDNEGHATFKDLGFVARKDHTFDVYAGGGFGVNGSRFGILIDSCVDPLDISYYIFAYARDIYMKYGDYGHRGRNRSRFILEAMGEDAFRNAVQEAVRHVRSEGDYKLTIERPHPVIKGRTDDRILSDPRIGKQKQPGLYYVTYKPLGGTPDMTVFSRLLTSLSAMEGVEIRLNADETAYIINLTAQEARTIADITADDTARTAFEQSVSCIGATVCQQGLRDSHGTFIHIATVLRDSGKDTTLLPKCHFSGCPSNCTVQQLAILGLRGSSKKTENTMEEAFDIYAGGSYAIGHSVMGTRIGTITAKNLPAFFLALNERLLADSQPFTDWYPSHTCVFQNLIEQFE